MRAFVLSLLPLFCACKKDAVAAHEGKVVVVATTGMVADLARVVGGPQVVVIALMGPGVDPHLYQATSNDLDRLRAADLVLISGHTLEGKMGNILLKMARKGTHVVAVTEDLPRESLLEPRELAGHTDPHIWFDVGLWARTIAVVRTALGEVDPAHTDGYARRAAAYEKTLAELHEEVKRETATIPRESRVLITSHDAFRYFGRAYDVEVRGLQGISTVDKPGVKDVTDMADFIVARGVKAIFVETSVNPKALEAVKAAVRARGHKVVIGGTLFSDAMGDHPPEDTYVGMVRANVKTLVEALR